MYVIGDRGLERTRSIRLQENTLYYMGASDSPKRVLVLRVTPDWIHYRDGSRFTQERRIQRPIGEDLIARGTRNRLKSINIEGWEKFTGSKAPDWMYAERARLKAILAGEPVEAIDNVPAFLDDQKRAVVEVTVAEGADFSDVRGQDPWYALEAYGNVGGAVREGVEHYRVEGRKGTLKALLTDSRFEVLRLEEHTA